MAVLGAFIVVFFSSCVMCVMRILNCLYRGKYRPPNASTDGEKPLYLHISAGANVSKLALFLEHKLY